jgi:cellulose synthase/poly-beta-1,6-N-acetylglucosamine synthase-like glycosyltransferase
LIAASGANIGRGRNIAVVIASGDIIVSSDSGCRLDARWVERIVHPFEDDSRMELVAGSYETDPRTLLESVVGMATMRGALDPVDPESFNPSCRSVAYTKSLWNKAGRFPDWTEIDDTLFNMKLRRMKVRRCFAGDAIVYWRPRSTLGAVYRQFRFYATTRGHTQLGAESIIYNLRNLAFCLLLLVGGFAHFTVWFALAAAFAYFHVFTFHGKARRIAAALGTWRAYPLSILVHWAVILGGVSGYLKATCQRWRDIGRYRCLLDRYLTSGETAQPSAGWEHGATMS